jgi:hypothetical protein
MNTTDNTRLAELRRRINQGDELAPRELHELLRLNAYDYRERHGRVGPINRGRKNETGENQREGRGNQTDKLIRQGGR